MSSIILNADRDEKFLEEHGDLIENARENDYESAPVRERKIREVYIPPEEKERLLEMYTHVVVQDFEDEYHMSREEREKMKEHYEKFFRLKKGFTKKIRRLDKYVEACRLCMDIIRDTAETNGIYDPDEFVNMVLRGQATINGLNFPKFQGKGKKLINWEYVAEFVYDKNKDIRELTGRSELAEENMSFTSDDLFDFGELEELTKPLTEKERYERSGAIFDPDELGQECAQYMSKKDRKKLIKIFPGYVKVMKDIKKSASDARKNSKIWQLDQDQLQFIEEYDAKVRGSKSSQVPVFKGEATKQSDVDAYLYAMEQWEEENTLVEFNGRWITKEDLHDLEYKRILEESGYNLRNLYDNKEREKKLQKAKESDKKRIRQLKKMLAEIQDRTDRRDSGEDVDSKNKVNKKKKKKDKKSKKKAKKYDEIILDAVGADDENMKMYKKRMEKMKWGED